MLEIEMNDMGREQAPPLSRRQAGAVIAQQRAAGLAPELREQQYGAGDQEPDAVPAVAIERLQHASEGRHKPAGIHLLLSGPARNRACSKPGQATRHAAVL